MMHHFTNRLNRIWFVGVIAVGMSIAISALSVVRAERAHPANSVSYDCSSGAACVEGNSTGSKTWGVYGASKSADGVHGVTNSTNGNSAVAGISTGNTGSGHGIFGKSSNGYGVEGESTGSGSVGVYGESATIGSYGVYGKSDSYVGVFAEANSNYAKHGFALAAFGDNSKTALFDAYNAGTSGSCVIDADANLTCTGKIGAASVRERHRSSSGQHVLTYAAQSATATVEDVGTARMIGGVVNVQIDPAFASVMDHKWYYVFLTPLGDTRGLYVSMKALKGFQVRETDHGRSSLEFDYRIVAHPLDADNDRLPGAPAIRAPENIMRPSQ
jgi:hypothetical protein